MTTEDRVRLLSEKVASLDLSEDLFMGFIVGLGADQACRLRRAIRRMDPFIDRNQNSVAGDGTEDLATAPTGPSPDERDELAADGRLDGTITPEEYEAREVSLPGDEEAER